MERKEGTCCRHLKPLFQEGEQMMKSARRQEREGKKKYGGIEAILGETGM